MWEGGQRGAVAESDGLNDTCTLGRGWSRTELDHDDWTEGKKIHTHTHITALFY